MSDFAGGSIVWNLDVDDSKLSAGLQKASQDIDKVAADGKSKFASFADSVAGSFQKAQAGSQAFAATLAVAGGAAVAFGVSSVKAFNEAASANAQTEAVLQSTAKSRVGVYEKVLVSTKNVTNTTQKYTDSVKTAEAKLHDLENRMKSAKNPTETQKLALEKQRGELVKLQGQATKTVGVYKDQFNPAMQITAEEVKKLAAQFQQSSTFADEVIQGGENMLLTFTNIGKDTLPAATQAMLDMSTAMGTDVKQTAIQLGKALNDPIQGASALRRVGVQLTDQQEKQIQTFIKQGKVAEAQKVILNELATEFGGSASKQAETFAGKLTILKNNFGDLQESIGEVIVNAAQPLVVALNNMFAAMGGPEGILRKFNEDILPKLQQNLPLIAGLIIGGLTPAVVGLAIAFGGLIIPLIPFLAAGAAVGLIIQNWGKIMEAVRPIVEGFTVVLQVVQQSFADFVTFISTIPDQVSTFVSNIPKNIAFFLGQAVGIFVQWNADVLNFITGNVPIWINSIANFFATLPGRLLVFLNQTLANIIKWGSDVITFFEQLPNTLVQALSDLGNMLQDVFRQAGDAIINEIKNIPGRVSDWGKNIGHAFVQGVRDGLSNLKDAFAEGFNNARGTVEGHSPPREGPFKNIDQWGFNVGMAWVEGARLAMSSLGMSGGSLPGSSVIQRPDPTAAFAQTDQTGSSTSSQNIYVNIGQVNDKQDVDMISREIAFKAAIAPAT